jgi:electron transport complex protein RnfC
MKRATFKGGFHLDGHKELTSNLPTVVALIPDRVYIPLSQHIGAPGVPWVVLRDEVKNGQKIGTAKGFVTPPIHASVSGKVVGIEVMEHPAAVLSLVLSLKTTTRKNGRSRYSRPRILDP